MKKLLFVLFLVGIHFFLSVSASAAIFKHTGKNTAATNKAKQLPQVFAAPKAEALPASATGANLSRALETATKHAQEEATLSTKKQLLTELLAQGRSALLKDPEITRPYQAARPEMKPRRGYLLQNEVKTEFDISPLDYYAILLGNLQPKKYYPELFAHKKYDLNKLSYQEVTQYAYLRHQIVHLLKDFKNLLRAHSPLVKIREALHQLEYHLMQMTRFMAKHPAVFAQALTQLRNTSWQEPSCLAQDLQDAAR